MVFIKKKKKINFCANNCLEICVFCFLLINRYFPACLKPCDISQNTLSELPQKFLKGQN